MLHGERGKLFAMVGEENTSADDETACPYFDQLCENCMKVAYAAGIQDMEFQPKVSGCRQNLAGLAFRNKGIVRADKECHDAHARKKFVQQLQPLGR